MNSLEIVKVLLCVFIHYDFIWGLYLFFRIKEVNQWKTTEGVILSINLNELQQANNAQKSNRLKIEYSYTWTGKEYHSKKVCFADSARTDRHKSMIDTLSTL